MKVIIVQREGAKYDGSKACKMMEISWKYLKDSVLPEKEGKAVITLESRLVPLWEAWFC